MSCSLSDSEAIVGRAGRDRKPSHRLAVCALLEMMADDAALARRRRLNGALDRAWRRRLLPYPTLDPGELIAKANRRRGRTIRTGALGSIFSPTTWKPTPR
jgi:hypothetical protein